jgi:hypothetical protein
MPSDEMHRATVTIGVSWLYWRAYRERPSRVVFVTLFGNRRNRNAAE